MRAIWVPIIALATIPAAAQAEEFVLHPNSDWHLDYAEEKCRIARTFGEGENATLLYLEQRSPSAGLTWLAAGEPIDELNVDRAVEVRFGPTLPAVTVRNDGATFGDYGAAVFGYAYKDYPEERPEDSQDEAMARETGLPALDLEDGAKIEWLSLSHGNDRIVLRMGPSRAVFAAMNECMENLVSHWGLDVAQQKRRVREPEFSNVEDVAQRIQRLYPSAALRAGAQAVLDVRVMVDASGKPTQCVRRDITVAEKFDDSACDLIMEFAEFEPAEDNNGNAIPSYYLSRIRYIMP